MSPGIKYGFGRVGLFVILAVPLILLTPRDINFFLKLMIAFVISSALGYVVLRRWRQEVSEQLQRSVARRAQEKERLRAALAGEDDPTPIRD